MGWIFVFSAIAVLFRPDCLFRFGALIATSLLNLWNKLPFVPNHILFEGMLHVIMLLGLVAVLRLRGGTILTGLGAGSKRDWLFLLIVVVLKAVYHLTPAIPKGYLLGAISTALLLFAIGRVLFRSPSVGGGEDWYARFAPVVRWAIPIVYIWALIQKLNIDYLNPEVSCAAKLHNEIAIYFGGLIPTATWAQHVAIWGSFALELIIPICLFVPRLRYLGFCGAVGFHLWLAIHPAAGIFSFSTLILAILALFLATPWRKELHRLWQGQLAWLGRGNVARGRKLARWIVVIGFFACLISQGALYLIIERSFEVFQTANRIGFVAFMIWGVWLGACYLISGWRTRRAEDTRITPAIATLAWIGLLPVLANGVWPWIGGRTQTSFSMYSNLRSEGEGNHLFLKRVDWLKSQSDFVEILSSEPDILIPTNRPRGIQQFANPGLNVLPWFEFRRLVSEQPDDFAVSYQRDGEQKSLGRRGGEIYGDEAAFEPLPLLARKFVWFRRLESLDGPMPCTH